MHMLGTQKSLRAFTQPFVSYTFRKWEKKTSSRLFSNQPNGPFSAPASQYVDGSHEDFMEYLVDEINRIQNLRGNFMEAVRDMSSGADKLKQQCRECNYVVANVFSCGRFPLPASGLEKWAQGDMLATQDAERQL
jgi:hypothetical protein